LKRQLTYRKSNWVLNSIFYLIILFLITTYSHSQQIAGIVLDTNTNKPVQGVHIYVKNKNINTITNELGEFIINGKDKIKKNDTLKTSHIAYEKANISIKDFEKDSNLIYLIAKTNKIDEVKITKVRKLNSTIRFRQLPPLKKGLEGFGSLIFDNKIYVSGGDNSSYVDGNLKTFENNPELATLSNLEGFIKKRRTQGGYSWLSYSDKLYIYDIEKEKWNLSKHKLRPRAYHKMIKYKHFIYILGGKRLSTNKSSQYLDEKIEIFDLKKNNIQVDETNPHSAVNSLALINNDHLIVLGGSIKKSKNNVKTFSDLMRFYNLKTGLWYELGKMLASKEVNGISIDNKIYLIGGFNGKKLPDIESFDLTTGIWSHEGNLFEPIASPSVSYFNGVIYIFNNGKINTYDLKSKILNEYLVKIYTSNANMHFHEGKLYILGGHLKNNYSKNVSEKMYSIDIEEFNSTKILKSKNFQ